MKGNTYSRQKVVQYFGKTHSDNKSELHSLNRNHETIII